jgi:hypothetical protein
VGTVGYAVFVSMCICWAEKLDHASVYTAAIARHVQVARILIIVLGGLLSIGALWATKYGDQQRRLKTASIDC